MRIGIDLMGSDRSPSALFPAVLQAAEQLGPSFTFVIIATEVAIKACQQHIGLFSSIQFLIAQEAIEMDDNPLEAVRRKKRSSLIVGMHLLKKKQIDALISCGNTGALIASASLILPKFPGVKRPALVAMLPTEGGSVAVLDVGGRVQCKAEHLVQYASLGVAFQRAVRGVDDPAVGLLNIGVESKKGTVEVRAAYEQLQQQAKVRFVGNVEARDLFKGNVDVLVTDGFTGNVLLKTAEGVARFVFTSLAKAFEGGVSEETAAALKEMRNQFDYTQHPGAFVCGVERVVVKVHGDGVAGALLRSIMEAVFYVEKNVPACMKASNPSLLST